MLRITEIKRDERNMILLLEGKVAEEWVPELRRACQAIQRRKMMLTVNLKSVDFVDPTGVALLKGLASREVRLVNCTEFLRQLLQEECPCEPTLS